MNLANSRGRRTMKFRALEKDMFIGVMVEVFGDPISG
jgi:hypothetical protein